MLDPAATLEKLIALPSVNPMGGDPITGDVDGRLYFEHRVTGFLEATFAELGLPTERHEVHPGRENILARLDAGPSKPTLMLEVHQDTVPVAGMTIEPFAGELRDGRIYGRGACDVKGAMACILAAVSRLEKARPPEMPNIVIACTVNEEHGFTGAQHLAKLWRGGQSKLLPKSPDAIVVAEPTELNVVVAHKGVVRWKCQTLGRAAHSSNPTAGVNAIYRMAVVLGALEGYAEREVSRLGHHALLGHPTLSIGTIHGGISVNTVPDRCTIEIDRRILPTEDPETARRRVIDYIDRQCDLAAHGQFLTHEQPYIIARGLADHQNAVLADRLLDACRRAGESSSKIGVPFGTDASAFGAEVPTVVFGPGSIAQAHTDDEWISVDQLQRATEILVEFCRR